MEAIINGMKAERFQISGELESLRYFEHMFMNKRGVSPIDFAILLDGVSSMADVYENALLKQGITHLSDEALTLMAGNLSLIYEYKNHLLFIQKIRNN